MADRRNEDADVEFACEDCANEFDVAGRFNAEGAFEPFDLDDLNCDECGGRAGPVADELTVVESDA